MKKILILSHTRSHSNFKIGSHHYANELAKQGHQVYFSGLPNTIFHKMLKKSEYGEYKLSQNVSDTQLTCLLPLTLKKSIFTSLINPLVFQLSLSTANKVLKGVIFDTIVCDYPFFYEIIKKLRYKNIIYRPTDDYVSMSGDKTIYYEKEICKLADRVVCTSQTVANNIATRYGVKKMHVITNGYDHDNFYVVNNGDGREGAIYIGALDERFDFNALEKLAAENINTNFDIYGPLSSKTQGIAQRIELLGNVKFHGALDYSSAGNTMNKYKIGLLLLKPGMANMGRSPMKLWEYIACGLNVLYSNIDNISGIKNTYQYFGIDDISRVFNDAMSNLHIAGDDSLIDNCWENKGKELNSIINEI